jgi:hypothetical protein
MVERSAKGRHRLRCAIYTRKSSEEGLEQEFNSLDAQREACEAFIASQRHEGWTLLRDRYDDGGFSGGTMERPALQRLLADIATSRIDVVVVYKVDRLTRALSDFARIVEGYAIARKQLLRQFQCQFFSKTARARFIALENANAFDRHSCLRASKTFRGHLDRHVTSGKYGFSRFGAGCHRRNYRPELPQFLPAEQRVLTKWCTSNEC